MLYYIDFLDFTHEYKFFFYFRGYVPTIMCRRLPTSFTVVATAISFSLFLPLVRVRARETTFKVSTLKVFYAWHHPLIKFKTDACSGTRSRDIALTPGCTDFTSRHAAETDSGNEI